MAVALTVPRGAVPDRISRDTLIWTQPPPVTPSPSPAPTSPPARPQPGRPVPKRAPAGVAQTGADVPPVVVRARIAFTQGGAIWTVRSDGSGLRRLTEGTDPDHSPDGGLIVFARAPASVGVGRSHLWTMKVDGTGARQLTSGDVFDRSPRWSPDGRTVAFTRSIVGGVGYGDYPAVHVVASDGTDVRRVTACPSLRCVDATPDWSPDGRGIVFSRDGALNVVRPDGSEHVSFHSIAGRDPAWSRDGRWLAFADHGTGDGLWVVDADGLDPVLLVAGSVSSPSWTADGAWIVYARGSAIALVRADGGGGFTLDAVTGSDPDVAPA